MLYSKITEATSKCHNIDIKGKPYMKVAQRVKAAHLAAENGLIITTEPAKDASGKVVYFPSVETEDDRGNRRISPEVLVFKAIVKDMEGNILATGHASEVRGSSDVNTDCLYENVTTSAVGRALGNLGLGLMKPRFARDLSGKVSERIVDINNMLATVKVELKNKDNTKIVGYYSDVASRILAFYAVYPQGRLETEILSMTPEKVIMEAKAFNDEGILIANAIAEERKGSSFVNKGSYLENCETSALGRVIAFCGIGVDEDIASADEVANSYLNQSKLSSADPKRVKNLINAIKDLQIDIDVFKNYYGYEGDLEAVDEYTIANMELGIQQTIEIRNRRAQQMQQVATANNVPVSNIAGTQTKAKPDMVAAVPRKKAIANTNANPSPAPQQTAAPTQMNQQTAPATQMTAPAIQQTAPAPQMNQQVAPQQTVPQQMTPAPQASQQGSPQQAAPAPQASQQMTPQQTAPVPQVSQQAVPHQTAPAPQMTAAPTQMNQAPPTVPSVAAPMNIQPDAARLLNDKSPVAMSAQPETDALFEELFPNVTEASAQPATASETKSDAVAQKKSLVVPEGCDNIFPDVGMRMAEANKPVSELSPQRIAYLFQNTQKEEVRQACAAMAKANPPIMAMFNLLNINIA